MRLIFKLSKIIYCSDDHIELCKKDEKNEFIYRTHRASLNCNITSNELIVTSNCLCQLYIPRAKKYHLSSLDYICKAKLRTIIYGYKKNLAILFTAILYLSLTIDKTA